LCDQLTVDTSTDSREARNQLTVDNFLRPWLFPQAKPPGKRDQLTVTGATD